MCLPLQVNSQSVDSQYDLVVMFLT